jgi:hypothetical protein
MRPAPPAADGGAAAPDPAARLFRCRGPVVHPPDVFTVVLAWLAVLAVCVAAVLFGQTARTASGRRRRRSRVSRLGLFISLSGPWLVVLAAVAAGAVTGAWLVAAAAGACGVALTAIVGLTLCPR